MPKAKKTRAYIIEKVAPVFNKKGYSGTSITDMTDATGLTKGSIYGNFTNKDDVAIAVFDYNLSLIYSGINSLALADMNAIEKLQALVNYHRNEYQNIVERGGCPILNTATEADDSHPALKQKVAHSIVSWKKQIESIINQGITQKQINPSANAAQFATLFISLVEGGLLLAKTTGSSSMLEMALDHIERLIDTDLKQVNL